MSQLPEQPLPYLIQKSAWDTSSIRSQVERLTPPVAAPPLSTHVETEVRNLQ